MSSVRGMGESAPTVEIEPQTLAEVAAEWLAKLAEGTEEVPLPPLDDEEDC